MLNIKCTIKRIVCFFVTTIIILMNMFVGGVTIYAQRFEEVNIIEEKAMKEKITGILKQLCLLTDNKAVLEDIDWLTFYISLIPIPVLQQAGQVANKIVGDHNLNIRFEEMNENISNANSRMDGLENNLERIAVMAETVHNSPELERKVKDFIVQVIRQVEEDNTEFIVDTSNWSMQVLLRQIIQADMVSIRADNYSKNIVQDSKIKAKKTELIAKNHSINVFDKTHFQGEKGSVDMQGIGQTGMVDVESSIVTFKGSGSSLIFGSQRPKIMKGKCPFCEHEVKVEKDKVFEGMLLKCPNCGRNLHVHVVG